MLNALDDAFKYCNEAIRLFKTQDIVDSKHSDLLMKVIIALNPHLASLAQNYFYNDSVWERY